MSFQAINGEPLPPNEIAAPTSSFDGFGRFIVSSIPLPKDEVESASPAPSAQEIEPMAQPAIPSLLNVQTPAPSQTFSPPVVATENLAPAPVVPVVRAADLPYTNEVTITDNVCTFLDSDIFPSDMFIT